MNAKVTLNIAPNATLLDQEHDLDFLVNLLVDSTNLMLMFLVLRCLLGLLMILVSVFQLPLCFLIVPSERVS